MKTIVDEAGDPKPYHEWTDDEIAANQADIDEWWSEVAADDDLFRDDNDEA